MWYRLAGAELTTFYRWERVIAEVVEEEV